MDSNGNVVAVRSYQLQPFFRWHLLASALAVALTLVSGAQPLSAAECGECDAGCYLKTDAFALMEEYKKDKAAFTARSNRCSSSDETWSEISDTIKELDQPPPKTGETQYKQRTQYELMMINHYLRIESCMLFCGLEQFRERCVGGPGGMSCECKPGAEPYCRSQSNQGLVETIAPSLAATMGSENQESSEEAKQWDVEETNEPEPEPAEEAWYLIEVAVAASGFEPSTVFAPCSFEPSSVTVSGRVTDDAAIPVANAWVTLEGLGARITTDARGYYSLTAQTEGDTPFSAVRDVMIVRRVENLKATVTPVSTVWANGREYEAVLTVTAEGLPLAGKEITVTDWKGFSRRGGQVEYVTARRGNNIPLRLDDAGQVRFRFEAPVVPRAKGAAIADPGAAFPVDGHFRVMVRGQEAETSCDYVVESPFPKIGQIRVPGNVDAGLWQVSPSSIVIEDPDSNSFRVTVRGLGDFRTTQPGAPTKAGMLTHELTGKEFAFLYRPPQSGFDPTALPDELDQFMNTSKNIYIGVVTNVVGGMLVDKVQVVFPSDSFGTGLSKLGLNLDAGKLLDAGGNMANVVNLGSGTYLDASAIQEDPSNPQNKIVAGGNFLIGVVDTSMGFAGTLGSVQQKLYWEGAKAYWEYVKLLNSLTTQYQEIGNAYQGTRFYPVEVTVEDESGHRTTASRACSVREWVGGSQ
jgi:hypothetical protein